MSRLLIVDDDELTLELYSLMFEDYEEELFLEKATSATKALSYLKSCAADQWPDFIFIDLHMPELNGFEFVEALQEDFSEELGNARVYILTSSVSLRDEEEARKYPVISGLLSKPLTQDHLQKIIQV